MDMLLLVAWQHCSRVSLCHALVSAACSVFLTGFAAMWEHFRSAAVAPLVEAFSGFVRVPLASDAGFQKWYDDIVEEQLLAAAAGNRGRAAFLSKKKTKLLRYALPQAFLEQFFHREAARAAQEPVPDIRNCIEAEDVQVAASILDFLDQQRPHFQTMSGQAYAPSGLQVVAPVVPQPQDSLAVPFPEAASIAPESIPALVASDTPAFVTAVSTVLASKKVVAPLKDIQGVWKTFPDELGRRISKMQNAALSTLITFQAVLVTENTRGPKITKVCRFPAAAHLNATAVAAAPAFNTHDACILVVNAAAPQPPFNVQWPAGASVQKELASANVPPSAMTHSDSKVAAARSLLRELRLVFTDSPPDGAPWNVDDFGSLQQPLPKRLRPEPVQPPPGAALMPALRGVPPPLPPPLEPPPRHRNGDGP